jgi:hypothetical protein
MWESIIAGLIANFLTTLIGAIGFYIFILTDRMRLLRFFGINRGMPNIKVYVSRLNIVARGAEGCEELKEGYVGPAITKLEYDAALMVCNTFGIKLLARLPQKAQDWLAQRRIGLQALNPSIDISPECDKFDEIRFDNMVIAGSTIYNSVAKYYFQHETCHFSFEKVAKPEGNERVFRIRKGGMSEVEIRGRSVGRELGILQRIHDRDHGNTVFLCAGLGGSATYGTVRFLIQNWRQLQRKYKYNEFALCLAFENQLPDGDKVVEPEIVYSYPQVS